MQFTPLTYTCPSCGAPQKFSPVTGTLRCEFCQSEQPIDTEGKTAIVEHDLRSALQTLEQTPNREIRREITCTKCGGSFTLTPYEVSSNCPYCGTPAITDFVQEIHPESILPFRITQKEAQAIFAKWIGSLWFAPSELKRLVDTQKSLKGYYLPWWTYDADTVTDYTGERGDIYYVTVQRRMVVNGEERLVEVQEPRTHWSYASGEVRRSFDDVTVQASSTISRKILDALEPWDTTQLVPFDTKYLSGFETEEYTIGLDNGFEMARAKMDSAIRADIRRDIGGDQQRILDYQTHYYHTTWKNALFPLWITHFTYKGKAYHYAINAQTGHITGERPYSYMKIAMLIVGVVAVLLIASYLDGVWRP